MIKQECIEKTVLLKISKNLARYKSENNISWIKIIYIRRLSIMSNASKNFDQFSNQLSVLHNYFDGLTKLFSDLYLAKLLHISAKSYRFSM